MTSSKDEYDQTRELPRSFEFEGGPSFRRLTTVDIIGGAVLWTWESESGNSRMVYRKPADEQEPMGRGVYMMSKAGTPPMDAGVALASAIMPDDIAMMGYIDFGDSAPSILLLAALTGTMRRPGCN